MKTILCHFKWGGKDRFDLRRGSEQVLNTGSSVLVLKALRRLGLPIPKIMGRKACWDREWSVTWNTHARAEGRGE